MLPQDSVSFLWGLASGATAVVLSSFLGAAGSDLWRWLKAKISPPPPPPVQVDSRDLQPLMDSNCAWVHEDRRYSFELKGYRYFPHPANGARCFRMLEDGDEEYAEWLMVKPEPAVS